MPKSIVVAGATLACSLGAMPSKLQVPKFHGSQTNGQNQANIGDCIPNVNIMPFQLCKMQVPPPPCVPNISMKWINGQADFMLDGEMALLKDSIIPCLNGGIIEIKDNGQKK